VKREYKTLARNYSHLKVEIDIIALKENILVVVGENPYQTAFLEIQKTLFL